MAVDASVLTDAISNSSSSSAPTEPWSPDAHRTRWAWQSPLALVVVGFGASLLGQATIMKKDAADGQGATWAWVAAGTASLIALNAGLSLFGDAVKHRTLFEMKR